MGKKSLPPGFRFHPTDVELVKYYLKRKVMGKKLHFDAIAEVDIYKFAPWDLPDKSCLRTGDLKWYFFCPREKKYASGTRMNRATDLGYWKTTGKDRCVHYNDEVVGMIKTLVFHRGKAPKGDRTDWVMHEYRLEDKGVDLRGFAQDAYVICSVFKKDGPGPKNGAQYGAPFKEEDWDDDDDDEEEEEEEEVNCVEVATSVGVSALVPVYQNSNIVTSSHLEGDDEEEVNCAEVATSAGMTAPMPVYQNGNIGTSSHLSESTCVESTVLLPSELPSESNAAAVVGDSYFPSAEPAQVGSENDGIFAMLANFLEESPSIQSENDMNEVHDINHGGNNAVNPNSNGIDIYDGLGDLGNLTRIDDGAYSTLDYTGPAMDQMLGSDDMQYLELMDLDAPLDRSTEPGGYEQVQTGGLHVDENQFFNAEDLHCVVNSCNSAELFHGTVGHPQR
ncbi:hypothetical protein P3X46_012980 [Hevea brasiliensis]|uniref:NAC domain-containing protein n=1 Tax=Hevea brasiliensis TaxID=3981 RepID=A0ABQ9MEL9_HEVBR|nr:NAC domain-containing protein 82 isoform X2 [Hevea brasiliensis]KAJ9177808.1 hypothetical protein P3X46_012980 [Hevea brasiliensis]